MKQFNEIYMIIKTKRESHLQFNASFLQNAREEKAGECIAKKMNTLVIYDDMTE